MAKLVSKVYGDALFETAMEKELVDTLYEETSAPFYRPTRSSFPFSEIRRS